MIIASCKNHKKIIAISIGIEEVIVHIIFVWLLRHNKILTKYNLRTRGWQYNVNCLFCGVPETVHHLFVTCPFISIFWSWIDNHNNIVLNCTQVSDF